MADTPATSPPSSRPPTIMHWRAWHSISVIGLAVFFVWMAVWLPWGLYASWIVTMVALSAFTLIVGRGVTGAWKGAFVDDRLRMSLSRLQMITWTILIVAAFGTIAIARAQQDPLTALNIGVPETIWLLLGISTTSLIGSPLIKNAKKETPVDNAKADSLIKLQLKNPEAEVVREGQVVKNTSIDEASLADIFMGELVDNFTLLDIGKIQMFLFTVLIALAYGSAIAQALRSGQPPDSLPDIGGGALPLLGISHAGYLLSKATASTSTVESQPIQGGAHG